ncbi:hypothetical protein DAPPUDRAFT_95017 [Daphnia pulex]|uniref:Uncharacterized protein n=1 Tax=Daphnia pulex TaxID=6669 RepID=E9FTQ6_DAPPU|nr:hypothetical protein DAPPUDRAFT_95017 [Daphnia pulex]|eukprot:EFX89409.1 hypothetical protein DAPPUDRAFT_95017 [Daphnia pulex]
MKYFWLRGWRTLFPVDCGETIERSPYDNDLKCPIYLSLGRRVRYWMARPASKRRVRVRCSRSASDAARGAILAPSDAVGGGGGSGAVGGGGNSRSRRRRGTTRRRTIRNPTDTLTSGV